MEAKTDRIDSCRKEFKHQSNLPQSQKCADEPNIKQAIHFLPLHPAKQLDKKESAYTKNRLWKLEFLQTVLL